jgi:hypothetical protein
MVQQRDGQGRPTGALEWSPLRTHAPLITNLKVTYQGYSYSTSPRTIARCVGLVDNQGKDHIASLNSGQAFAPFNAVEEGPALYLGFSSPFPEGEWVQVLLNVAEEVQSSGRPPLSIGSTGTVAVGRHCGYPTGLGASENVVIWAFSDRKAISPAPSLGRVRTGCGLVRQDLPGEMRAETRPSPSLKAQKSSH